MTVFCSGEKLRSNVSPLFLALVTILEMHIPFLKCSLLVENDSRRVSSVISGLRRIFCFRPPLVLRPSHVLLLQRVQGSLPFSFTLPSKLTLTSGKKSRWQKDRKGNTGFSYRKSSNSTASPGSSAFILVSIFFPTLDLMLWVGLIKKKSA